MTLPRGWRGALLLVGLGALAALGQAPVNQPLITILALAFAFRLVAGPASGWAAFGRLSFLGAGYFAIALHWIVEPFLVASEVHGWMAPFALVLMASGGAVFWGLAGLFARAVGGDALIPLPVALGVLAAEILRSYVFTGFPWALIGHALISTPYAQWAAWIGPHGLSALVLGIAAMAATKLRAWVWLPIVLALMALGFWAAPGDAPAISPDAPVVRIVQPNARQEDKWDPEMRQVFYQRALALSGDGGAADMVVWPETSFPYWLGAAPGALEEISRVAGAPVLIGALRRDGPSYYNTLAVVGEGGVLTDTYDKTHLVPFGEYIPFADLLGRFGLRGFAANQGGGYAAGETRSLLDVPGFGPVLPLICYEGIFAEEVNDYPAGARAIVLVTNDAWFGDWAGPAQHFAQARLRAIEQGMPVVRAANTGISGLIDARGRVIASLPMNTEGALTLTLPERLAPTLYSRWGDWPVFALWLVATLIVGWSSRGNAIDPDRGRA